MNKHIFLAVLALALASCTTQGPNQIAPAASTTRLPDITLQDNDSVTVHPGQGCALRSRTPGADVVVTCLSATPNPSATVASSPTTVASSPTAAASPTAGGKGAPYPIGIRLDNNDPMTLDRWNARALPTDAEHSQGSNTGLLLAAKGNDRQVACGGAAVIADGCQAAINYALAAHIIDLNINDEGPDCPQLMIDEALVYKKVHAAGLTMMWAPTGTKLRSCAPNSFTSNTDSMMFQFEALQNDPKNNLAKTVHDEIALLHSIRPGLRIACQASVNPQYNRLATAQQVLADIASVQDGSADQCDRVDIFYSQRAGDVTSPQRADVMLQVQAALRP